MVAGVPDLSLPVLIETYWNVKHSLTMQKSVSLLVLIETYWNVKVIEDRNALTVESVLIETYWNVKILYSLGTLPIISINRNILECKVCMMKNPCLIFIQY